MALPQHIKALILDMDGVIWKANAPIGDLPATFDRIRKHGLKFVFATNNGTKTPEEYRDRLAALGVEIEPDQVVTSALCIASILAKKYPRGTKVFMIGSTGIRTALQDQGLEIVSIENASDARVVVMGVDWEINFQKVSEATLLVRGGTPFYATNPDRTFPTPRGEIPGNGAWISVITTATGIDPIIAGKPFPYLMDLALERLGTTKEETLVVGDRLETDIAAGHNVGCPTALVLSGVSTLVEAEMWKQKIDFIADDLASLVG